MAEEKNSIFRKKAMDRISSPEEMDDYLQVTGPSTWIVLVAIMFLILGFIIWGIFGRLDTTMNVAVVSEKGSVECYIPGDQLEKIVNEEETLTLEINREKYELAYEGKAADMISNKTDESVLLAGNLIEGEIVQPMAVKADLEDGVYVGKIVVETVSPIHFILN